MVTTAGSRAGLTLAVLSAATFGTSGAFASSLIGAGWSPAAAVITRIAVMWGLLAAVGLAIYFLLGAGVDEEPLPPVVMAWAGMCVGAAALAVLGWAGVLLLTATTGKVDFIGHRVSWVVPVLGLSLV